jgi:uncharacterized membrane protein YphA (DoxX/SURF4 family)
MNETNQIIAVFIVRVYFGIIIFLQGYDKVFKLGIKNVIGTFEYPLQGVHHLPHFLLVCGVVYTSFVELVGGVFLIAGFATHITLYCIALDLLVAAIGLGIMQPMWDMKHIFPRFLMLIFLLIMPTQLDVLSVDHLLSILNVIK